jgi:hypothetical protein
MISERECQASVRDPCEQKPGARGTRAPRANLRDGPPAAIPITWLGKDPHPPPIAKLRDDESSSIFRMHLECTESGMNSEGSSGGEHASTSGIHADIDRSVTAAHTLVELSVMPTRKFCDGPTVPDQ